MTVRMRKTYRWGPVRLHFVSQGLERPKLSSWSIKVGPWSWNSRRRSSRVDLPGPWHWQGRRKPSPRTKGETTRSLTSTNTGETR